MRHVRAPAVEQETWTRPVAFAVESPAGATHRPEFSATTWYTLLPTERFASQDTDDSPVNATDAAPVYPFSSPMTATARRRELSSAAEIAVVPASPEVETREPLRRPMSFGCCAGLPTDT